MATRSRGCSCFYFGGWGGIGKGKEEQQCHRCRRDASPVFGVSEVKSPPPPLRSPGWQELGLVSLPPKESHGPGQAHSKLTAQALSWVTPLSIFLNLCAAPLRLSAGNEKMS